MKASDTTSPQRRGSDVHREEVIVVGAGQAGLSMGYWLRKLQRSFLLLEAGPRIGESWRQRYDSLVLFTPRRYSALPGLGAWLKAQPEPVLGLELKRALRERQVRLKPRATSAQGNMVQFADGSQAQVRTVIWATGYRQDFSWIHISGALDEYGQPGAQQGVSTTPGLFFLGFPWQPSRGSALVG
jgi:putative flavoprotein involved in K+ transport